MNNFFIFVVLLLFSCVGCATTPKDFTDSGGDITAEVARQQIGSNTSMGIVDSVIGALAAIPGVYDAVQYASEEDDEELSMQYKKKAAVELIIAILFISSASKCFSASSEWEGELYGLQKNHSWLFEKNFDFSESASLRVGWDPLTNILGDEDKEESIERDSLLVEFEFNF